MAINQAPERWLMFEGKVLKFVDRSLNKQGGVLFINGPWGSGKTYFWKKCSTKIQQGVIYVSLFGVRNTTELKSKIISGLIAGGNETGNVAKIRGFLSQFNYPKLFSSATGINLEVDVIELIQDRKIICFDDLERISSEANIDEILGFINHLAEHKSHRCVVILNEDEMNESKKELFHRLREKLSLTTLEYRIELPNRTLSFFNDRFPTTAVDEVSFLSKYILELKVTNLRVIKTIVELLAELKDKIEENIPDDALKFLASIVAHDSDGNKKGIDFFQFNPIQLYFRASENADKNKTTVKTEEQMLNDDRNAYYEKYFGKNSAYRFYPYVFDFVRSGVLDEARFRVDVLGGNDSRDEVGKKIDNIKNLHLFFCSDTDLSELQTQIETISKAQRTFQFQEVCILIRALSSSVRLLEQPYPLSLPADLRALAEISLKIYMENLWQLESSFGYRGDDLIWSFSRELKDLSVHERVRRAKVNYDQAISTFDVNALKEAIAIDGKCLSQVSSSGDINKILAGDATENIKSDLLLIIIEGLQIQQTTMTNGELKAVHGDLMARYLALTSKTERLRIYRLIEKTGLAKPLNPPSITV